MISESYFVALLLLTFQFKNISIEFFFLYWTKNIFAPWSIFSIFNLKQRLLSVTSLIHPSNYILLFVHFIFGIVTDWQRLILIHRALLACAFFLRNYCKLMSLSCGPILESFKYNRNFFFIYFNLKLSSIKCNIFSNALFFL